MIIDSKYQLKTFVTNMSLINYFNDTHKIIRISYNKHLYDFKYVGDNVVPNPNTHVALVTTCEEFLNETHTISKECESLLPGLNPDGSLRNLDMGEVTVISRKQQIVRTNPNSGGAGFSISKTNMFDMDKVALAISPPLDIDYTNTDRDDYKEDKSIGIFINTDGAILIKSKGSSITMGEEGVYIGGDVSWESSEHTREWMRDNTLSRFIPSTIVTFPLSIPELPNIAKFAQIAEAARKVRNNIDSIVKVGEIIGT